MICRDVCVCCIYIHIHISINCRHISGSAAGGWTQELLALAELLRCAALEAADPERWRLPKGHTDAVKKRDLFL